MAGGWTVGEFRQYGMVLEVGAQQTDDDMWFRIYRSGEERFDSPFIDLSPAQQIELVRLLHAGRDLHAEEFGYPIFELFYDREMREPGIRVSRGPGRVEAEVEQEHETPTFAERF